MRDLSARLREVVKRERARPARGPEGAPAAAAAIRELTYVPDPDPSAGLEGAAARLGGIGVDQAGACVGIDYRYAGDRSHGRRRVEWYAPRQTAPLHVFDRRVSPERPWWRHVVFFDVETTGLSGGAGTLAFLAGCGWFDDDGFVVRQFFLAGPSGERAMLQALGEIFAGASLMVTFNGRTFDVPLMETRWAFHRQPAPTDDLAHFDMLPAARKLWGNRTRERGRRRRLDEFSDESSCRLSALERTVLGFHRLDDVPGLEIPARYFHFLRTGDAAAIAGVLEHNRYDILSLAAVMAHAMWLAEEGAQACREPSEQVALGRLYEGAGQTDRARAAYELAADARDSVARRHALARLALLHRRAGQYEQAASAWQGVLDTSPLPAVDLSPLERQAAEALAIHHEHRVKDPRVARRYATLLNEHDHQVRHRLDRLERKIQAAAKAKDGRMAVPLLDDEW